MLTVLCQVYIYIFLALYLLSLLFSAHVIANDASLSAAILTLPLGVKEPINQVLVVQKLDSTIHRINNNPGNSIILHCPMDRDLQAVFSR